MPHPFPAVYPKTVQSLIRQLNTPTLVQHWIHSLDYNPVDTMRTLKDVVQDNRAHCLEAALAAAAILEHHGYPPLILDLESADLIDHTLFLYQHKGIYGTVAMSRDVGLYGRKPIFKTIRALVQSYTIPYIDERAAIKGYGVLDLRTLKNQAWRDSERNVWYVEDALRRIPHTPFKLSADTVQHWRERYRAFKKKYPARQPDYYPGQRTWV